MNGARICRPTSASGLATHVATGSGQHLVIDVTNFSPKTDFVGTGGFHLIELDADRTGTLE
jgi:hypothetical protein